MKHRNSRSIISRRCEQRLWFSTQDQNLAYNGRFMRNWCVRCGAPSKSLWYAPQVPISQLCRNIRCRKIPGGREQYEMGFTQLDNSRDLPSLRRNASLISSDQAEVGPQAVAKCASLVDMYTCSRT